MQRRNSRAVGVGDITIGGGAPVSVQSMLSVPSTDIPGNVRQGLELEGAGCQLVRVAVPDQAAIQVIHALKGALHIPVVADIHFDWRLALGALDAGVDKIRLNPGNIGDEERVKQVVEKAKERRVPIRIGVNAGSLEKSLLARYGAPTPDALCESALGHLAILERLDFTQTVVSIKSSSVQTTIESYRLLAGQCDYPLHLGVTETGTQRMGLIKSAIGIGSLLCDGIGDTIRVSLTADPVLEIAAANDILRAAEVKKGLNIISCPTCGRTRVGLFSLVEQLERALLGEDMPLTVAVMGCEVNGPGEAREADLGVACGEGCGLLFSRGEVVKKVPQEEIVPALLQMIQQRKQEV